MDTIPQQLQDRLAQFQNMQGQLQSVALQRQQIMQNLAEIDNALKELGDMGEGKVYTTAGPLFIETDKEKSQKKLEEDKELKTARLKTLEKQEAKLRERLKGLGAELQTQLQGVQGGVTGG